MKSRFDLLKQMLEEQNRHFSHVAFGNDGALFYQVDDQLMLPTDADELAQGSSTPEEIAFRNRQREPFHIEAIAEIAAIKAAAPFAKPLYDIGKDGWLRLKPNPKLSVDVLDSAALKDGHSVYIRVTNRTTSGISLEDISVAKNSSNSEQLSLKQTTARLLRDTRADFDTGAPNEQPSKSLLPILLGAESNQYPFATFNMVLTPRVLLDGKPRQYAVADLTFWKLDEAQPDRTSFTFRLR